MPTEMRDKAGRFLYLHDVVDILSEDGEPTQPGMIIAKFGNNEATVVTTDPDKEVETFILPGNRLLQKESPIGEFFVVSSLEEFQETLKAARERLEKASKSKKRGGGGKQSQGITEDL